MENNENEGEILITQNEVWDVMHYASAIMGGMYGYSYLTPDLLNTVPYPRFATQSVLDTVMGDPNANEAQLQEFSQHFELTSMVYKRLISYLANMLSFDITYTSDVKPDEYKIRKYKNDLEAVESFLDNFEYENELRLAVKQMLRNDVYFACFRKIGSRYTLQELPPDFCKITGRWEGGFLFSFNMAWFYHAGVDINDYPDFFKKKMNELLKNKKNPLSYKPSNLSEFRVDSLWTEWVEVPPEIGVCFKLSPELATRLPYFMPMFKDLLLQDTIRTLQKNANMATASRMLVGEVPLLNDDTKTTVKDSIAISPELLGKFMALVKSAISDSTIKFTAAPLKEIQAIQFDAEPDIYSSYLKTVKANSGANTNLIFSGDTKQNAIETQLSLNSDEQMMTILYEQFNMFLSYQANRLTKTFRFWLVLEGTDFYLNRNKRLKEAMDLLEKGIVLPQKIAAAMGMKPSQMRKHMEEAKANGFVEMLTPPSFIQQKEMAEMNLEAMKENAEISAQNKIDSQQTGSNGAKGRPRADDSEISDEGLRTREQATNVGRGGQTP